MHTYTTKNRYDPAYPHPDFRRHAAVGPVGVPATDQTPVNAGGTGKAQAYGAEDVWKVKPQRIQLSRKKGWRMPPNTVKVDRTTKWGNPYRVGYEAKNAEIAKRKFFIFLCGSGFPEARERMGDVRQLRGKNLACWCKLGQPCHADVLLEIANA